MITEQIISILMAPVFGLLDLLPAVSGDFIEGWTYIKSILVDIFTGLGCFIPLGSLAPLLYCVVALHVFRIILAIVIRIKSFIPLMGGA